eukprot:CAMPEP_0197706942 /NCGR_PEP_ID=MMETSP1338-20131121/127201_1 /TAXON_ID=43686 ORGANISM="Pelagodinium beii, Strain RCC1491" /NCGR_SAMPLE_ID=MMETSP1338 /ASSEMBLY_ACC=CAM_ASM_000754 /LENGTH=104 /DNA_ID=CAMNT_0043290861 /DNA_START=474 /DNA_END=788 /DNA_ORIENTATION=-
MFNLPLMLGLMPNASTRKTWQLGTVFLSLADMSSKPFLNPISDFFDFESASFAPSMITITRGSNDKALAKESVLTNELTPGPAVAPACPKEKTAVHLGSMSRRH